MNRKLPLLIAGFLVGGLAATITTRLPAQAQPRGDSLRLRVDGMVCSLCAYGVERRLSKLDQVERVKVDLDSGLVVILLKPRLTVGDSTIAEEVRRAGFALRRIERFTRAASRDSP